MDQLRVMFDELPSFLTSIGKDLGVTCFDLEFRSFENPWHSLPAPPSHRSCVS